LSSPLRDVPPRPYTAAAARSAHRLSTAEGIINDDSRWALCPGNPGRVTNLLLQGAATAQAGRKPSVVGNENTAIRWWCDACDDIGTSWLRDDPASDPAHPSHTAWRHRERLLLEAVIMYISSRMMGRAAGVGTAQISSVMKVIGQARAIVKDCGGVILDNSEVQAVRKGLVIAHVKRHGQIPVRQTQPWPRAHLLSMLSVDVDWSSAQWIMLALALVLTVNAGFRKVAISIMDSDDPTLMMDAIEWYHDGKDVTDAVVDGRVTESDLAYGRTLIACRPPAGDKTDYTGRKYGSHKIWFHYDPGDPLNVASWLLRRERLFPAVGAARRGAPVITPDGVTAYKGATLDRLLRPWQEMVMSAKDADSTGWHSGRVTLANCLAIKKHEVVRIKEFCRWSDDASVAIYKRFSAVEYANVLASALKCDAKVLPTAERVTVDDDDAMRLLQSEDDAGASGDGAYHAAPGNSGAHSANRKGNAHSAAPHNGIAPRAEPQRKAPRAARTDSSNAHSAAPTDSHARSAELSKAPRAALQGNARRAAPRDTDTDSPLTAAARLHATQKRAQRKDQRAAARDRRTAAPAQEAPVSTPKRKATDNRPRVPADICIYTTCMARRTRSRPDGMGAHNAQTPPATA